MYIIRKTAADSGSDTDKSTRSICIFIVCSIYTLDDVYDKYMCIHYTFPKKVTPLYIPSMCGWYVCCSECVAVYCNAKQVSHLYIRSKTQVPSRCVAVSVLQCSECVAVSVLQWVCCSVLQCVPGSDTHKSTCILILIFIFIFIFMWHTWYRVAKTHRMPYLYKSFPAKEPYN